MNFWEKAKIFLLGAISTLLLGVLVAASSPGGGDYQIAAAGGKDRMTCYILNTKTGECRIAIDMKTHKGAHGF